MSGEGIEPKGKTMAHDAPQATGPSKLVIRNIGLLLSGALEKPQDHSDRPLQGP